MIKENNNEGNFIVGDSVSIKIQKQGEGVSVRVI